MKQLSYSLVLEPTDDPGFFGFYSPELEGFSGAGTSIDDCLQKAPAAIDEYANVLVEEGLPIPPINPNPTVFVENSDRVIPYERAELSLRIKKSEK